jgi:hypothetical protein
MPNPAQIPMNKVDSTHLAQVGHDPQERTLQVAFRDSSVYQYFGVPTPTAQALLDAESKGQFFNRNIRSKYKSACIVPKPKKV